MAGRVLLELAAALGGAAGEEVDGAGDELELVVELDVAGLPRGGLGHGVHRLDDLEGGPGGGDVAPGGAPALELLGDALDHGAGEGVGAGVGEELLEGGGGAVLEQLLEGPCVVVVGVDRHYCSFG